MGECVRIQQSAAEAIAFSLRAAGRDLRSFLDALNVQLSKRTLTREHLAQCFPAADLAIRKMEQCEKNNDQKCVFSQQEADEINKIIRSGQKTAPCTGVLADPVTQTFARKGLADMRNANLSGLSLRGVLEDFAWRLSSASYEDANTAGRNTAANLDRHRQLTEAIRKANPDTWRACFPGLADLLDEVKQRIQDAADAKAKAEAEAKKPGNRLLRGYKRYAYVKYCNEVRQGYVVVYVNDIELERAKTTVKAIEDDALREDGTLDTDATWKRAIREIGGLSVNRDQCQFELNALLQQSPRKNTIQKDF